MMDKKLIHKTYSMLAGLLMVIMADGHIVVAQIKANTKSVSPTQQQDALDRTASAVPTTFVANVLYDQKQIWTAPFKAKVQDLNWIVPMIGLTAGMINADAELSSRIDTTGTFSRHANTISNAGLAAALGGAGGLYLLGKARTDDHQRETGILGIEAATNSLIVTEALKVVTLRQRPTDGDGKGEFFQNGSILNSSFPSAHAMITWSVASVLAHEYPGVLTQAISYGAATTVSLAR